ncbi:MAG: hypothetical protein ACRD4F_07865, partial [Candidatus Angelobacter sp.]
MSSFRLIFVSLFVAGFSVAAAYGQASSSPDLVLLKTLQQELDRAMSSLSKAEPAPYFISYSATDEFSTVVMASNGALVASMNRHQR